MKKIILFLIAICCVTLSYAGDDKQFKKEGNVYSSTGRVTNAAEPVSTGFVWQDKKGNEYPIYMSSTGSCFVIKTSSKTGKQYKNYLGPEISKDICNQLDVEYKGKSKK